MGGGGGEEGVLPEGKREEELMSSVMSFGMMAWRRWTTYPNDLFCKNKFMQWKMSKGNAKD